MAAVAAFAAAYACGFSSAYSLNYAAVNVDPSAGSAFAVSVAAADTGAVFSALGLDISAVDTDGSSVALVAAADTGAVGSEVIGVGSDLAAVYGDVSAVSGLIVSADSGVVVGVGIAVELAGFVLLAVDPQAVAGAYADTVLAVQPAPSQRMRFAVPLTSSLLLMLTLSLTTHHPLRVLVPESTTV